MYVNFITIVFKLKVYCKVLKHIDLKAIFYVTFYNKMFKNISKNISIKIKIFYLKKRIYFLKSLMNDNSVQILSMPELINCQHFVIQVE